MLYRPRNRIAGGQIVGYACYDSDEMDGWMDKWGLPLHCHFVIAWNLLMII